MKKRDFILYLFASVLGAAEALIEIWRIIPGNSPEYVSLGSQMFGKVVGPISDIGLPLVLCIIFAIYARDEYITLKKNNLCSII
ncbi:MAG: hypothetical protein GXY50_09170 [Syntrophomonadaceae bacterium]|nr:hypothetical protein [Syntrophomonadaceae bacterium]